MNQDAAAGIETWNRMRENPDLRRRLTEWYNTYGDVQRLVDSKPDQLKLPGSSVGEKRGRPDDDEEPPTKAPKTADGDGDGDQQMGGRYRRRGKKTRRGGRRGRRSTKKMGCW